MTEIREGQKIRRPSGKLATVRVAFTYIDSVTGIEYLLVAYRNGGQDRFPV
jgi:hypothetical protein